MTDKWQEVVRRLDELPGDNEADHSAADGILLEVLGELAPEVSAAWLRADRRCDGFWYA